jgi:phosphoribosylformimino-5-aminoimidazole carboxamide ribotide isomerase
MDILPAIDLRGGEVVRLSQGDYDRQTTYADDPVAVAGEFVAAGARWIHMVDLDAARSGRLTNTAAIARVCEAVRDRAKVQCGGGLRDRAALDALRAAGVARMVIGSAALKDPAWFEGLLAAPDLDNASLALGLDARAGRLAAEGWTESLPQRPGEWARRVRGSGLGAMVYTDIARDGMLTGVNLEATAELIAATDVPVIASGGVRSLDDVIHCKEIGCAGVIIGRAYYEGTIDVAEACAAASQG